ncbi:MAG: hypothetical protein AAFN76_12155 [Pseudomonadota bacterium]
MDETPKETRVERLPQLVSLFLADCATRLRPSSVEAYRTVLKHAPDISLAKVSKNHRAGANRPPNQIIQSDVQLGYREEITDKNPYQHLTARYGQNDRVLTTDEIKAVGRMTIRRTRIW